MSGLEIARLHLGAVHLIATGLGAYSSSIQALKRYTESNKEIQRARDTLKDLEQFKEKLSSIMYALSVRGEGISDNEERQLCERVVARSMALSNIFMQRLRNIDELERQRGRGTLRLGRRSRKVVQELFVQINKMYTEIMGDMIALNARMQRVSAVENDALPFQQVLSDSEVYRQSNNVPSGLAPVQFEEIFPDTTLPDQDGHQEDPEEGEDEADAADWSKAEFYSGETQEETEDKVDDSSSIRSLMVGATSITASCEDRLPHRTNDGCQTMVYEVFIYGERGNSHRAECLLDTGASLDCISQDMARKLQLKTKLKQLRKPAEFVTGSGELLAARFVVESTGAFINKPNDCYNQPLYVLKGVPYDMVLSASTIFQSDFLLANLEISSFGISTTQEGFERLLPLGLPKQEKVVRVAQDKAAAEASDENEEQRQLNFAEFKRQAADKKKQAVEKMKKEDQRDEGTQGQ